MSNESPPETTPSPYVYPEPLPRELHHLHAILSPQSIDFFLVSPKQGETHAWLARAAGRLKQHVSAKRCFEFLREVCDVYVQHRDVPDAEIDAALKFVYADVPDKKRLQRGIAPKFSQCDSGLIEKKLKDTLALFDPEVDTDLTAAEVLPRLFSPGDLICGGLIKTHAKIQTVQDWLKVAGDYQFVVPNPMRGAHGLNKLGKKSARCQSNVRYRRLLVAEFDDKALSKAMQAQLLSALDRIVPLKLAVDSGGKSLHGWFQVDHLSERNQVRFYMAACALGADPSRWDICGFVRMPGGTRKESMEDGSEVLIRQRIVYARRGIIDGQTEGVV